jgi:hypothetical protein
MAVFFCFPCYIVVSTFLDIRRKASLLRKLALVPPYHYKSTVVRWTSCLTRSKNRSLDLVKAWVGIYDYIIIDLASVNYAFDSLGRYVHIGMYIRTTLFLFDREALFYFAGLVHYSPARFDRWISLHVVLSTLSRNFGTVLHASGTMLNPVQVEVFRRRFLHG